MNKDSIENGFSRKHVLALFVEFPLALLTLFFGVIVARRYLMPYNEDGRYFDEGVGIVYHDQAVVGYGILFLLSLAITIAVVLFSHRRN